MKCSNIIYIFALTFWSSLFFFSHILITLRQDLEPVENGKAFEEAQLSEKPKRRKLKREISDLLTNEDPEYKPQKKIKKNGITTRKRTLEGK